MKTGLCHLISALTLIWWPLSFAADVATPVSLVFAGDIVLDDAAGEMIRRGEDPFVGDGVLHHPGGVATHVARLEADRLDDAGGEGAVAVGGDERVAG